MSSVYVWMFRLKCLGIVYLIFISFSKSWNLLFVADKTHLELSWLVGYHLLLLSTDKFAWTWVNFALLQIGGSPIFIGCWFLTLPFDNLIVVCMQSVADKLSWHKTALKCCRITEIYRNRELILLALPELRDLSSLSKTTPCVNMRVDVGYRGRRPMSGCKPCAASSADPFSTYQPPLVSAHLHINILVNVASLPGNVLEVFSCFLSFFHS